jgi:hypothetical protein
MERSNPRKELLNGYVGAFCPKLEQQMRAKYHSRNGAAEIESAMQGTLYEPYLENISIYVEGV